LEPDDDEPEWIMLISELSFPHLQAAHDERLARELERRRVVQERLAESPAAPRRRGGFGRAGSSERMPRAAAASSGPRTAGACPA
jgi:hypothetical protein